MKSERIHSLDALRAIMMLLGLVIHSALTYNITPHGNAWSIKDPNSTHILSDFIVLLIHSFRMPIFFVVAGFFGALLFYERQPSQMIKNRISRIVFPFIVFLWILWPITVFSFRYTHNVFNHIDNPLKKTLTIFTDITAFFPKTTSHLWFLYYLSLITGSTVIISLIFRNKKVTKYTHQVLNSLIQKTLIRVLFLFGIIFITLTLLKTSMVKTSVSLIPDRNTFIYFFIFYCVGWLLYKSKNILHSFMHYDWVFTVTAIILASVQGLIIEEYKLDPSDNSRLLITFSAIVVCLFISGIIGLFVRYASKHSHRMRYISDASYWVYLIHLPLTAIIPAFLLNFPIPAMIKFLIVLTITTIICFVSYHFCVRNTFIGKFLNGQKYPT
ncbi:acyltransferase family protein [Tenacibaculum jejuense]|uniref:Acyltransferase 3 domain-containing protein n=1 Tax=Tenacibaculum jejuense TaxID=584609 RepID=A0A238U6P1_9FLAO|nr:acyltransferase family protein [Tenacibaculum jejuense]SNR14154.1 conserved membrane protein of unknown function [Tenacibaculum jejuense]